MKKPAVLIVDDEAAIRQTLELVLKADYEIIGARDGKEALAAIKTVPVDITLLDVMLPGMDGLEVLARIKEIDQAVGVIMLSASDSASKAVSAMRKGAYDYVTKPFDNDQLLSTLKRYVDWHTMKGTDEFLKASLRKGVFHGIVSKSAEMRKVFELIEKVGKTSSNVLITGESGTGKELVARAIQSIGERRDKPFVIVNCGAVPSELMESELFGHEKGSFTGAVSTKIGKFEFADGGTVFLDEISTLQVHLQAKLLRVLQEKVFERVGSNLSIKVDIRVIAATNIDLEQAVKKGSFREDLYYRLKVVPIDLPPLRDRKGDIPILVKYFLDKHSRRCGKTIKGIAEEALDALNSYSWPGNVRELENLIERLVVLAADGGAITYEELPITMFCPENDGRSFKEAKDFHGACMAFEKLYIIRALNKTNWNRAEAARTLNIHRNTLLMKMKTLGITPPDKTMK